MGIRCFTIFRIYKYSIHFALYLNRIHFIVIYASFSKFKVFRFHENLRINDEVFINKIFADLWFDSGNK